MQRDKLQAICFELAAQVNASKMEGMDLKKRLDSLRNFCHAEGYDIFNWEVKNIEVSEDD